MVGGLHIRLVAAPRGDIPRRPLKENADGAAGLVFHDFAHGADVVRGEQTVAATERDRVAGVVDDRCPYRAIGGRNASNQYGVICFDRQIETADVPPTGRINGIAIECQATAAVSPGEDGLARRSPGFVDEAAATGRNRCQIRRNQVPAWPVHLPPQVEGRPVRVRGVQDELMRLEAPFLENGRADPIGFFLPENHDIERYQYQLFAAVEVLKRHAGGQQRAMNTLRLIVPGAAPGAGIDTDRRGDLGPGDAYAAAKLRVPKSSSGLISHHTSPITPRRPLAYVVAADRPASRLH